MPAAIWALPVEDFKTQQITGAKPEQGKLSLNLALLKAVVGKGPEAQQCYSNRRKQGHFSIFNLPSIKEAQKRTLLRIRSFRLSHDSFQAAANSF